MIPEACSQCHSTAGFLDYIGADGSEAGVVDAKQSPDPATAMGISCMACHDETAEERTVVTFPSGIEQEVFTPDIRCMTCHGGRNSTVQVLAKIEEAGSPDPDTTSPDLGFVNIHYRAAAASRFGGEVQGGFEYDGKDYVGYYFHDQISQTCNDCHNPHTLEVKVESCMECHDEVVEGDKDSLLQIRTSKADFDGNGDVKEGIQAEIQALHTTLLDAIMAYGEKTAGAAIGYDSHNYPYFFVDGDGSGAIEEGEAKYPNRYQTWTPRLLEAAYNYQVVAKDPGMFTHNPYYALQLLHDSIADLADAGSGVAVPGERPN
ncbi:polyheme membrane-associated cytochrome C [Tropicimonas sp. IMCC6043]|nr:polyheme membrane-associated cytochrome C [Tropicimonas sp. IMCC6043]